MRVWFVLGAVSCGGDEPVTDTAPEPEPEDTGETGLPLVPTTVTDCVATGVAQGCLVELAECAGDVSFDGTPGGWFHDVLGENTVIHTAPSPAGKSLIFTVFGPRVLGVSETLAWGMEFTAEMVDVAGDTTNVYDACSGSITVDSYTPGYQLSITWDNIQFEVATGVQPCRDEYYWNSAGELEGASFWL